MLSKTDKYINKIKNYLGECTKDEIMDILGILNVNNLNIDYENVQFAKAYIDTHETIEKLRAKDNSMFDECFSLND